MSHRVDQIGDALEAAIRAQASTALVFRDRVLTLTEDAQELPAISVSLAADQPIDAMGVTNTAFIDSLVEFDVWIYAAGSDETACRAALVELRRQVHIAVMATLNLGLTFVLGPRYAGADRPAISGEGKRVVGALCTHWRYDYRMNVGDPQ
jgi:hypothetical protein